MFFRSFPRRDYLKCPNDFWEYNWSEQQLCPNLQRITIGIYTIIIIENNLKAWYMDSKIYDG